jgi:hypothetical protein
VAGHAYAIEIDATTKSTLVGVNLSGTATFRLDNVAVTGLGGGGGNGSNGSNGGGNGSGGVSSARLESLIKSSGLVGPAVLKGNKLTVKAKCPAQLRKTCTLRLQGMLNRHRPATVGRRAKVKKGKTKKFALKVKPASRKKVKTKKKLLFKEVARVGKTRATVYKRLGLVRK